MSACESSLLPAVLVVTFVIDDIVLILVVSSLRADVRVRCHAGTR